MPIQCGFTVVPVFQVFFHWSVEFILQFTPELLCLSPPLVSSLCLDMSSCPDVPANLLEGQHLEEDDPDKVQKSKSKGAVLLRVRVRVRVQLLFFVPAPFSFYFTARVWIVIRSPAYMHTFPAYMFLLLSFLLCRSPQVRN